MQPFGPETLRLVREMGPLALGLLGITGMVTSNFQEAVQKALDTYKSASETKTPAEGYVEVASNSHASMSSTFSRILEVRAGVVSVLTRLIFSYSRQRLADVHLR